VCTVTRVGNQNDAFWARGLHVCQGQGITTCAAMMMMSAVEAADGTIEVLIFVL